MLESNSEKHAYKTRAAKNILQLFFWAAAWIGTCALMAIGPHTLWKENLTLSLIAVAINFCVGVGLILAHKRYLAGIDDLQRKVYLDALAITVGVVLIVTIPYSILERDAIVHVKDQVSSLMILMSVTFVASMAYGTWRYR